MITILPFRNDADWYRTLHVVLSSYGLMALMPQIFTAALTRLYKGAEYPALEIEQDIHDEVYDALRAYARSPEAHQTLVDEVIDTIIEAATILVDHEWRYITPIYMHARDLIILAPICVRGAGFHVDIDIDRSDEWNA